MQKTFKALSSEIRRKILTHLSKTNLTAGEIAERFSVTNPTISKHLEILINAGLIKAQKKKQYIYYSLVRDKLVNTISGFLSDFRKT